MKKLTTERKKELFGILEKRFNNHMERHSNLTFETVSNLLLQDESKLWSIDQMELTGGEPDILACDDVLYMVDCSKESPIGRRSLCYDQAALEARKEFKPVDSAMHMAETMGITLLNEELYLILQSVGDFDTKTSSWLLTPADIRDLGGAIFGDKRYNHTFFYHNGVQSYYKDRGFRGFIKL